MLLRSSMIDWVTTVIRKLSIGRTKSGMLALASTVVTSETGIDFPEQYAAIAALSVKRVYGIEDADEESGGHDCARGKSKGCARASR